MLDIGGKKGEYIFNTSWMCQIQNKQEAETSKKTESIESVFISFTDLFLSIRR